MKDFSFWSEYEGASEGSGRSAKVWLINPDTGQTGLFKFRKDINTTDHISECIACQLAGLLDIPCAKFELGRYHGQEGSMSYNIVEKKEQILIEGIYFIALYYPEYDPERLIDISSQRRYSIEMVVKTIENLAVLEDFLHMLIFDYLIGNSDRHQNNWAIILENNTMKWSPLYDNGSSLCAFISEQQIESYLGKDKNRWRSLVDTKSKSMIRCSVFDEKRPTQLDVLKYLHENYFGQTCDLAEKVCDLVTEDRIYDILSVYSSEELSENKKLLILKYLLEKKRMLEIIYFGKGK